ncbi:TPA: hypothetical protein ACNMRD_003651 [Klebsiella pneumoniae]
MSITLENGRINLDSLVTIEDHLRGLALANRTLDSIKDQMSQRSDKKSDWYRRATVAHKSWFWARSRICEQLAILRRQEKDVNRLRWQYENEALMAQLKSQVRKRFSVSVCAGQKLKLNSDWSKTFVLR